LETGLTGFSTDSGLNIFKCADSPIHPPPLGNIKILSLPDPAAARACPDGEAARYPGGGAVPVCPGVKDGPQELELHKAMAESKEEGEEFFPIVLTCGP
jgi:hypothetical protein